MKLWKRKRHEVGLKEEKDEFEEITINPNEIESLTAIKQKEKEERKQAGKNKSDYNDSTHKQWDDYMRQKGGTGTNKDKQRQKAFKMTQHARNVLGKRNRTALLKQKITRKHNKSLKNKNNKKKNFRKR